MIQTQIDQAQISPTRSNIRHPIPKPNRPAWTTQPGRDPATSPTTHHNLVTIYTQITTLSFLIRPHHCSIYLSQVHDVDLSVSPTSSCYRWLELQSWRLLSKDHTVFETSSWLMPAKFFFTLNSQLMPQMVDSLIIA